MKGSPKGSRLSLAQAAIGAARALFDLYNHTTVLLWPILVQPLVTKSESTILPFSFRIL